MDLAVVEDVRAQTAAMRERRDGDARQALEVGAGLAQTVAVAFDIADPEALPDEIVQADAAGDDVAAGLPAGQADRGDDLRLDQGEILPAPDRVVRPGADAGEVAVAFQADACDRARTLHPERLGFGMRSNENLLNPAVGHRHSLITPNGRFAR